MERRCMCPRSSRTRIYIYMLYLYATFLNTYSCAKYAHIEVPYSLELENGKFPEF